MCHNQESILGGCDLMAASVLLTNEWWAAKCLSHMAKQHKATAPDVTVTWFVLLVAQWTWTSDTVVAMDICTQWTHNNQPLQACYWAVKRLHMKTKASTVCSPLSYSCCSSILHGFRFVSSTLLLSVFLRNTIDFADLSDNVSITSHKSIKKVNLWCI